MSESATGSAPIPLSPADRAILAMEGPTIAGHTCKVIRVGTPGPSVAALAAAVAARLPLAPALTWKLAGPPDAACWRADPAVDLKAHIAQVPCDSCLTTPPWAGRWRGCLANAWTVPARSGAST